MLELISAQPAYVCRCVGECGRLLNTTKETVWADGSLFRPLCDSCKRKKYLSRHKITPNKTVDSSEYFGETIKALIKL